MSIAKAPYDVKLQETQMKNKSPLYKQIYDQYKEMILSEEINCGTRLPSENVISQQFGVSRITVTRALKELELENLIYRVKGSGSYVIDRKNDITKSDGPDFISLILPNKGDFSSEILRGIEDTARKQGYFVTFHNSSESPDLEKELVVDVMAKGSAGFIVYSIEPKANMDLYSRLMISHFPFVLIDRKIQGLDTPLVWTNNRKATYKLACHLIEQGHTRIIFLGDAIYEVSSETERYLGYCQAHIDNGIPLLHKHLYGTKEDTRKIPSDYMPNYEFPVKAINYLFDKLEKIDADERPTAIMAVNDYLASLLIKTALKRGISIPGDYSITGFDNLPHAQYLPVPLTTAAQPATDIGRLAAEELFNIIHNRNEKPNIITVEAEIIVRESTGKVSAY